MKTKIKILTLFLFFSAFIGQSQRNFEFQHRPNQAGLEYNPLKGFVNSNNNNQTEFPTSLQFGYFGLNEVFNSEGSYNWRAVDRRIEAALLNGCQYILRFYIDYPGRVENIETNYKMPDFLKNVVEKHTYSGNTFNHGYSPNYNDPRLMTALLEFIEALGDKYNGKPAIALIDVGLVGRWGEWNYATVAQGVPVESRITPENGNRIYRAFETAFPYRVCLLPMILPFQF